MKQVKALPFTVGIEIEIGVGNTSAMPEKFRQMGWQVKGDGSIRSRKYDAIEIISPPYTNLAKLRTDVSEIKKAMGFKDANKSMGIHIHIRPVRFGFSVLFDEKFPKMVVEEYRKKFTDKKEQERLNNSYCSTIYGGEYFSRTGDADRYKFVNIKSAYYKHKTIEFRCFPSVKSAARVFEYASFVVDVATRFIEQNANLKTEVAVEEEVNDLPSDLWAGITL